MTQAVEEPLEEEHLLRLAEETHLEVQSDLNFIVKGLFEIPKPTELRVKKGHKTAENVAMLRQEFLRGGNWDKETKEALAAKYGMRYAQIYKLHWDWKEKERKHESKLTL